MGGYGDTKPTRQTPHDKLPSDDMYMDSGGGYPLVLLTVYSLAWGLTESNKVRTSSENNLLGLFSLGVRIFFDSGW